MSKHDSSHVDDPVRALISRRLSELGLEMSVVSREMGRNHAYLQQFLARGIPATLKEDDRENLAPILGVSPDLLRSGNARASKKPSVVEPPKPGDPIEDANEARAISLWRRMDHEQRQLLLSLMTQFPLRRGSPHN